MAGSASCNEVYAWVNQGSNFAGIILHHGLCCAFSCFKEIIAFRCCCFHLFAGRNLQPSLVHHQNYRVETCEFHHKIGTECYCHKCELSEKCSSCWPRIRQKNYLQCWLKAQMFAHYSQSGLLVESLILQLYKAHIPQGPAELLTPFF